MNVTAYHARYYAYDLTRRAATGLDRLSMSLFDAAVDLNLTRLRQLYSRSNRHFPKAFSLPMKSDSVKPSRPALCFVSYGPSASAA
jgi:hypothetical protein